MINLKPLEGVLSLIIITISQNLLGQYLDPNFENQDNIIFAKNVAVNVPNSIKQMSKDKLKEIAEEENSSARKKIYIHNLVGIQSPQFANLNADLVQNGFMKLNKTYLSRGGGFYTILPKTHLVPMLNYASFSANTTKSNFTNSVRGTSVGTTLGISIAHKSNFQLIPFGGIVYSWFEARISKNNAINQTVMGYLASAGNQQHIASKGITGNLGIHFGGAPFKKTGRLKNINLGTRLGKHIPFGDNKWTTNGQTFDSGPNINSHGFYASFILGSSL